MTPEVEAWNRAVATRRQKDLAKRKSTLTKWVRVSRVPSLHPFKALLELRAKVELIRQKFVFGSLEYEIEIAKLSPYKGRGHGGHHRTKNRVIGGRWSQDRNKYIPHQGKSEIARRVFQAMPAEIQRETRRVEVMI